MRKDPKYTIEAKRIRESISLIIKKTRIRTNKELVEYLTHITKKKLFTKNEEWNKIEPFSTTDISKAKNDNNIGEKKQETILFLIEAFLEEYTGFKWNEREKIYIETEQKIPLPKISLNEFNSKRIKERGILDVLDDEPKNDIQDYLKNTNTLRLLQTSIANYSDWQKIFNAAIEIGVKKIQILLAKPYSKGLELRVKSLKKPKGSFSESSIIRLDYVIHNIEQLDLYEDIFEIRLHEENSVMPIYQCLNSNNEIIYNSFGLFWHGKSSAMLPHLKLAAHSKLSDLVSKQFENLWEKAEKIPINVKEFNEYSERLKYEHSMRYFHSKKNKPENKNSYKAFYWRKGKIETFKLSLDFNNDIALVENTRSRINFKGKINNTNARAIDIFLTTNKYGYSQRIMHIQISKKLSPIQLEKHLVCLYHNSNPDDGIPYTKLMILQKIKEEEYEKNNLSSKKLISLLKDNVLILNNNLLEGL